MILQKANCSEDVIAAGLLHDILEDTETSFEELVTQFGLRIANLVLVASEEDKSLSWEKRKQHTIDSLSQTTIDETHIIVADKLHNIRSIRIDIEKSGEQVWERFNRGKADQYWYYSSIVNALTSRKKECKLIAELENEVNLVFHSDSNFY